MSLKVEVRVGRKRTLVIPKRVAEALGIDEGSRLLIEVKRGYMIVRPLPDAIHLSLHGEKLAKVALRELEETSIEEQEKRSKEA